MMYHGQSVPKESAVLKECLGKSVIDMMRQSRAALRDGDGAERRSPQ
jgi:hypothetical protein